MRQRRRGPRREGATCRRTGATAAAGSREGAQTRRRAGRRLPRRPWWAGPGRWATLCLRHLGRARWTRSGGSAPPRRGWEGEARRRRLPVEVRPSTRGGLRCDDAGVCVSVTGWADSGSWLSWYEHVESARDLEGEWTSRASSSGRWQLDGGAPGEGEWVAGINRAHRGCSWPSHKLLNGTRAS